MIPRTRRQVVILASALIALFYISYRILFTLNLVTPYSVFAS